MAEASRFISAFPFRSVCRGDRRAREHARHLVKRMVDIWLNSASPTNAPIPTTAATGTDIVHPAARRHSRVY